MVIDNLEKRGLVKRRRNQKDRRFVSVHLTPAGEQLIGETFPRHVQSIMRELGVLSGEQQDQLSTLCRTVGRQDSGAN